MGSCTVYKYINDRIKGRIILEAAAEDPIHAPNVSRVTSVSMMIAAVVDCVAQAKTSIAGNGSVDMESMLTSRV